MNTATVLKISRLKKDIKKIVESIYDEIEGVFSKDDVTEKISRELESIDLNNYRADIASRLVEEEDDKRARARLDKNLDLFTRELADQCIIRIGDGQRVKMRDATWHHLRIRLKHQSDDIKRGIEEMQITQQLQDLLAPEMEYAPNKTVEEAMVALGKW
jgi:hypothetical protein